MGLFNWFTQEIAIDLGTANTLIIHNDEVVVNEPSIVALDRNNPKNVLAVGKRALMMHEKTHESIKTIRPLKDGVIADFNAAELMLREMIKLVYPKKPLFPPSWRMMICIPSSITEVEKRAVRDSAKQAVVKDLYLIHEPMAAVLGIGIEVEEPVGNMIIDIGGGTTGITVIALAGIVCDQSIRIAGDEFTADIMEALRRYHSLLIGERTAEQIKIQIGAAMKDIDNPPDDLPAGRKKRFFGINHFDHLAKHEFGSIEISDYTVFQGTNGFNAFVSFFVHHQSPLAHCQDFLWVITVQGYNGRFIHYDFIVVDYQGIGGSQVYRYL